MPGVSVLLLDLKSYYPSPAYQLGLVAAYARTEDEVRKHVSFRFAEFERRAPARRIAEAIVESGSDLVAVSNYAWNYTKLSQVLDILDGVPGRPRIVVGGPNCAGDFGADMLRRHPAVSALIDGEGEAGFRDVCAALVDSVDRDPFDTARNSVTRDGEGGVARRLPLVRTEDLDEIPSPYLTGLLEPRPSPIFYETNRGCPYRCSFCYWGNGSAKVHRLSLDRIREELEFFAERRVAAFWLADANFGIFPDDLVIAEMMAEINARTRHPFQSVGVNWAKNSQERILEIAATLRRARIGCTTTLAVQSVTPEAEVASRRYSLPARRFVDLVRSADAQGLDMYTDLIWGLPAETVDQYLHGLEAVISTGVPAMVVHQLHLLPGTEFYERRRELGLVILSESDRTREIASDEPSPYADYVVVAHEAMNGADMEKGIRLFAINHLFHNHDLGRTVNFFLARYGVTIAEVYRHLDVRIAADDEEAAATPGGEFFADLRRSIRAFAAAPGGDEILFYRRLSESIWFAPYASGERRAPRLAAVREFLMGFYERLCDERGICREPWERTLLRELIDFAVLASPKPLWRPDPSYEFAWDVAALEQDIRAAVLCSPPPTSAGHAPSGRPESGWATLAATVRDRLRELLTAERMHERRGPVTYCVENPWKIAPSAGIFDWLLSSRSKHCVVDRA